MIYHAHCCSNNPLLSSHPGREEEFTLSEAVRVCPVCQRSDMAVRKKRDGGFMLSCLGYPECRAVQFFPPCVSLARPHSSLCSNVRCGCWMCYCGNKYKIPSMIPCHFWYLTTPNGGSPHNFCTVKKGQWSNHRVCSNP